ncbi:hypothetical protein B6U99_05860 [Candidatus Geothermarchaeota archaeon ex4572_27]|nr:MAG: hypothetical protein B6U99_05860 [Candidatus Geothermarchaeota archaeon ex4572_27]
MPKRGWTTVTIPEEVYEALEKYYAKHVEELRIKRQIKSISTLVQSIIIDHIKREDPEIAAEFGDRLRVSGRRGRRRAAST